MSNKLIAGFGPLAVAGLLGVLAAAATHLLPASAHALLIGLAVAALVLIGGKLRRIRRISLELAAAVEASVDHDINLPEAGCDKSLKPLIQAINHYGTNVTQLVGAASNRANQVLLVSHSLIESAEEVRNHAEHQAHESSDLATAMEQVNSTISDIAQSASSTFANSTHIAQATADSMQNMGSVVKSVNHLSTVFENATHAMEELRQASDEISKIVQVINGIAEQTNLLALNAAIEAARAGEHGRGFAVVADEVRKLAEITKKSTSEITNTIARNKALTSEVAGAMAAGNELIHASVAQTETTKSSLDLVATSIDEVNGMIERIAAATEQQSASVAEMTLNVERIAQLANETQARTVRSRQSAAGLGQVSRELEKRLGSFDISFLGLVPTEDALDMNQAFGPLCEYLGKLLGRPLFVRLGENYEQAIEDLGTGRALLSYQTPSTYVDARARFKIEPLVVPLAKGEPYYQSAIVVRADSGLNSLAELRTKRFAFGDAKSTGSKAMPQSMLKEAGIGLKELGHHAFVGSHDNVAKAVLAKDYDAGGLMLAVAEKYSGKGLKIVATSPRIPQFPLCASPKLSPAEREQIIQALVGLKNPEILGAMGGHVTGFARIQDSDYDGVRAMLKNLRG
ncbi:MAG: phosphate/phosphite/phosphonate ABC transporter substrate-binding protein [Rhodocyclaceae bacterium]|nr:phosphate/phosphite/phosphonate ABC transporter substrate-binding protein [Rhodocyclaceae bacterium]